MKENKELFDFLSKQMITAKEGRVCNLADFPKFLFLWTLEIFRHVHHCETETEAGLHQRERTEETEHPVTPETNLNQPYDDKLEHICSLEIPDRCQH